MTPLTEGDSVIWVVVELDGWLGLPFPRLLWVGENLGLCPLCGGGEVGVVLVEEGEVCCGFGRSVEFLLLLCCRFRGVGQQLLGCGYECFGGGSWDVVTWRLGWNGRDFRW